MERFIDIVQAAEAKPKSHRPGKDRLGLRTAWAFEDQIDRIVKDDPDIQAPEYTLYSMPNTDVSPNMSAKSTAEEPCTSQASAERTDEEPSTSEGKGDTESEQAAAAQDSSELFETLPVMPRTPVTQGSKRLKGTDVMSGV